MDSFQAEIQKIGKAILESSQAEDEALKKKHQWEYALLDWCMKNDEIRNRAFRFIDVFPALKSADAVYQHIREYFPHEEHRFPAVLRTALFMTQPKMLTKHLLQNISREIYLKMANLFIGGENEVSVIDKLHLFNDLGYRLSIDLLGEKTTNEAEALAYENRYAGLIELLGKQQLGMQKQNVSVKLSALDPLFHPLDPQGTSQRVRARLRRLLHLARSLDVFLHIDMEDYRVRDLTLTIVKELLLEEEFEEGVHVGIVLQAYLKDAEECFEKISQWSRTLKVPLTIRLVRGAYWDSEVMQAKQLQWPVPVFTKKSDCDVMFEKLTKRILEEAPNLKLAVASHNVRSIAYAMCLAKEMKIKETHIEFQLLYGMGAALFSAIREQGYEPRVYMPMGEPVIGMAYLVRRLLENVSSQSFMRQTQHSTSHFEKFLQSPEQTNVARAVVQGESKSRYVATALLQFHRQEVRDRFQKAINEIPGRFPKRIYPVVDGAKMNTRESLNSVSPIDGQTVLAEVSLAGPAEVKEAVMIAKRSFSEWQNTHVRDRASYLTLAADWLEENRYDLAALEVFEVGKTWKEADGDVVEAIDFLRFYAFHAERIMQPKETDHLDQEINLLQTRSRGVCVVIAPWNFPIAILTGMSAAALVTGNPIILKPAEQSMVSAWMVFEAFQKAGIPPGVIHFLPGKGEEVGPLLVKHPDVATVAFTGSKEVGLEIVEVANQRSENQKRIKKVVVEMGGKNAAIIDSTADFDEAIPAVLYSAFAFAGQKCSALSRLIILDDIYESFIQRLVMAAETYVLGDPTLSATPCGPVIDQQALTKYQLFRALAEKEGEILFQAPAVSFSGYFAPPCIVGGLSEDSRLCKEEIFAPILCVIRAGDFTEALRIVNRTRFALTGGVFSRTPSHIEIAKSNFDVGNLYINRQITGAVVGRQPFGGFGLSGGGTKAGSVDYLREFYIQKTVTENISRHGFAPLKDLDE